MGKHPGDRRPPRGPYSIRRPVGETRAGARVLRTEIDGTELVTRPMTAGDAQAVRDMHERCSPESIRFRYFGPMPRLSDRVIRMFTDPAKGLTLVTQVVGGERVVAMSNLMDLGAGEAELAFLVEDDWQGRGLGRTLLGHVIGLAPGRRVDELTASVYATNRRMLALLKGVGANLPSAAGMIVDLRMPVREAVVSSGGSCR